MRFAELEINRAVQSEPVSLAEGDVMAFARQWDPQPFHINPDRARASQWGGIIASGWHSSALAMRLFYDSILDGSESIGSPGVDFIKFLKPLRPGDVIHLRTTILDRRISESKPSLGIIKTRWQLFNQKDEEVYLSEATVFFDLRLEESSGP